MSRNLCERFVLISGVMAFASCLLASGGAQEYSSQVQQHFLAAQHDQQQGQLDAAVREYQEVLHLQPGLAEVYANLGLIYYTQAKFDLSASALAEANRLKPGMRGVSLWLGVDYVKLGRPAQGVTLLRDAVQIDPTDKQAQGWLATALWDAGQTNAALLQLRRATSLFPNDPDLLFARGEAYGKAANEETEQLLAASQGTALYDLMYGNAYASDHAWTKAEGHLSRAIERDPHSPDAEIELARVYLQQAQLTQAQEQIDRALKLAPRSATALARSGELLLIMQQQDQGLARIRTALAVDPSEALDALGLPVEDTLDEGDSGAASIKLATLCRAAAEKLKGEPVASGASQAAMAALYAQAGDKEAAMQAYRKIGPLRARPSQSASPDGSLFAQGMHALHEHHYDDAEARLERWLGSHPNDLNARYQLVVVRQHLFVAQVTRLLAVAPDSYHVHQLLGELYVAREEDDKALAEYRAVAAAMPDLPDIHFWLGHLYWKHGYADRAFAELTRELQLDPGHPEANGELGAILVTEGRIKDAIPHLELAIHSKPDLWPAYAQLGRAYAIEKRYALAEQVLRRAVAHDQDGSIHYQLGLVLRAEGKNAQAAEAFARVRVLKIERMAPPASDDSAGQGVK
jgi:tetratricopeptide (TPR) repeat protein